MIASADSKRQKDARNPRTGFHERWQWIAIVALAAPVIGLLAVSYYQHESRRLRHQAYNVLGSIAKLKAGQIEAWRRERISHAEILCRNPLLGEAVRQYLTGRAREPVRVRILEDLKLAKQYMGCQDVMLAAPNGSLLLHVDSRHPYFDAPERKLVRQAWETRGVVFGDLVRCPYGHEIHIDLAAPLQDGNGRVVAVVLLRSDPKQSLYPLIESWPTPSKTAETMLVRQEDGAAVVLSPLRFQKDAALTLRVPLTPEQAASPAAQAVWGRKGYYEGVDYRGKRVVTDILPVADSPWRMVTKVDADELLEELHYRGLVIFGFAVFSVLLTTGGAMNVYHRRERDLYRQLHDEKMQRLALTAHYAHVAKYAHDAMILADEQMRIVEANDRALALHGYSREELQQLTVADLRKADEQSPLDPSNAALLEGVTFETTHWSKDGRSFPVEVSARLIQVEGKRFYHEIIRDISDRKMAEAALKASEELFRTTLYSIGDAVIITDRSGLVRCMNPVAEALTGYSETEASGKPANEVFRIFSEDTGQPVPSIIEKVLSKGVVLGLGNHSVLEARDGSRRPIEDSGAPIRDAGGGITGVVLVFRDVSEARAAEKALQESIDRFRRLAENAPDMIYRYEFTPLRGFTYVSPAATPITGYSPEEFYSDPDLGVRIAAPAYRPAEEKLFHGEQTSTGPREVEWTRKDGTRITVEIRDAAVYDERGALVALEGMVRDITKDKYFEEQLRQAQKMEAIGRLAGGVAHDFNNLLTVINGYAKLAAGFLPRGDRVREMVDQILHAGERAAELTQHLLAFSRRQPAQPKALNLNEIIAQSKQMLARLLGEDIQLVTHLAPQLGRVNADPGQIHQILMNLAVNARDAMPDGGTLTIETANVEVDPEWAALHAEVTPGSYVVLAVSDTGTGMDAETQAHIFEPFFTTKEVGRGTGLGLATVYGIVRQYQGWIGVYSEPGRGSTFKVYLPRMREEGDVVADRDQALAAGGGAETILVVEDQAEIRKYVATVLRSLGYQVLEAAQGEQAISIAEKHSGAIPLLLTDAVMPSMSGVELAGRLKAARPEMRVLFMSGYGENVIARGGFIDAGVAYLSKPFGPDALAKKVREALDSHGSGPDHRKRG